METNSLKKGCGAHMNKYIHIINADGRRITSIVINILTTREKALEQAKSIAPNCVYIEGGDDMLDEFLAGKIYKKGVFVDAPVVEYIPTRTEKIANIKKYYDARFATLDQAVVRIRLINGDITDLQEQYNKLNLEMLAKIKAVN